MRLWLELAAGAARNQQPHRTVAAAIMDGFVAWTTGRLDAEQSSDRLSMTDSLLATIEGALFLDAIGRRDLADMAVVRAARQG